ncbi:ferric reductase-like transmembrane domain-containing protein [Candidatus Dojkabacteria bacterium]|uniref:Sulfoxide reductase heme-binding subunit YedZ n=2 Tax=Candidatus Dojkabacteria TaxID=74243 RepID=A0A136KEA7_9BACT|nr:MAG: Sulfoxide reductase heme-binding subunit YedZ [candidate division WS6 bacterium OLB21]MBW7953478.1 ferric reductase-like transmembrane domain-containing protein [Candidatus Dojkabacteria bacterium]
MKMIEQNKQWLLATAGNALILFLVSIVTDTATAGKLAAYMALVFLILTLIPVRVLGWLANDSRLKEPLRQLLSRRRDFGITSGLTILMHSGLMIISYSSIGNPQETILFTTSKEILPGLVAEVVFLILLITSNRMLTRKLGSKWKPIHRLVWLTLPLIVFHAISAAGVYTIRNTSILAVSAVALIMLAAIIDLMIRLFQRKPVRIQITTLAMLTIGYLAIVLLQIFP